MDAARALRAGLLRAARGLRGVEMELGPIHEVRRSLAELLDAIETPALIAVLSGPREALGLAVLPPALVSALIEAETTGRVLASAPAPRRTTATDAMFAARFLNGALDELTAAVSCEPDVTWAGGFRFASHLDDLRPLGLMLEEGSYRVLSAEVSMADGMRRGRLTLALPAAGRGAQPAPRPELPPPQAAAEHLWQREVEATVAQVPVRLDAVIARTELPLAVVSAFTPGMLLPLPAATLAEVSLTGLDGRVIATGRLGQAQGFRALRLSGPVQAPAALPPAQLDG